MPAPGPGPEITIHQNDLQGDKLLHALPRALHVPAAAASSGSSGGTGSEGGSSQVTVEVKTPEGVGEMSFQISVRLWSPRCFMHRRLAHCACFGIIITMQPAVSRLISSSHPWIQKSTAPAYQRDHQRDNGCQVEFSSVPLLLLCAA